MKKMFFVINVANQIDLITNSSSELFVLQGKTKEVVEEMISQRYPEYREEYEEIKNIADLTVNELDNYMSYMCSPHMSPAPKSAYPVPAGFTFDELYEKNVDDVWDRDGYKLRNNIVNPESKWDSSFITEENREEMINKLSPDRDLWFLFSIEQNPMYEMQQRLEAIGTRYHLG